MTAHGHVAARVAARKEQRPELYCPERACLWLTGGGRCPRHGGPAWTKARQAEAIAKSRQEAFDNIKPGDVL
jgi:hypothetical protein